MIFFFRMDYIRNSKKKGLKQNKLIAMEELRKQAEGDQLDIEFDEVGTYKAVKDRNANFKNMSLA